MDKNRKQREGIFFFVGNKSKIPTPNGVHGVHLPFASNQVDRKAIDKQTMCKLLFQA